MKFSSSAEKSILNRPTGHFESDFRPVESLHIFDGFEHDIEYKLEVNDNYKLA